MSEHSEGYRLSPQQRRLQRVSGLDPGRYCAQASFEVEGRLDVERLRVAVRSLVERHEVLRTGLARAAGAGEALQVIGDGEGVVFELGASHACVGERFNDTCAAFGTSGEGTLRVRCEQVDEGRWQVCLSVGSLWSDAAGMAALCRELWREYADDAATADEPLQYADVSEVMNELLEAENTKAGREFWEKQNPPTQTTLRLPMELTAAQTHGDFDPQCIDVEVGDELFEQLEGVCARHNVRAEDFLLTCWQSLLQRLSAQTEVEIATAFDGRNYEGLHDALGLFVRYLPLRAHIDTQTRFAELLRQTAESAAEFSKWQEYYTPTQTHAAQPAPTHVEHPFGFEYLRWPDDPNALDNATTRLRLLSLRAHTEPFRVKLVVASSSNGRLHLQWHYDPRRFDPTSARRLAAQYLRLLASAASDPSRLVSRLDVLTDEERHTALVEWNRTEVDYGGTHCLHRLFEQQAARTPEATALAYEDERLTYAELDSKASRLASLLRMKGVGPDVVVGLMMERSVEMVVSVLAVLKAGGAYLPLDPEYPSDRLSFMLEDSAVSLLLTQQRLRDRVPAHVAEVICVDSGFDGEGLDVDAYDGSGINVTPDNLAYVIYTSGSTGRPKGVMVSHRSISNRLLWMREQYPLTPADTLLQKTSLSFDASVWELFHPLQSGARLLLARPGGERDLNYLVETVAAQGVTVLQVVPSLLRALSEGGTLGRCAGLRLLCCGGESLGEKECEAALGQLSEGARVVNLYGPTEASIDSASRPYEPGCAVGGRVPLGGPIGNVRLYVLDGWMEPAPVGVAGELYVGGAGLARGYLGRPALTAERFVPDPFATEPGARLYRTGDVGRWLQEGGVEFLGRVDQQVKVRGYRIELGEVEAAVRSHGRVRECAVTTRGEGADTRLVAYVVPRHSNTGGGEKLFKLPNELEIDCLNINEARVIYKEIFEDESYLRHGVTLDDGDCVFDIGANIGLFTLFVNQKHRDLRVYAFEPIPPTFAKLRSNVDLYGLKAKLFNCGLSDAAKEAVFTFYPLASGMSGVYANEAEDVQVTRAFLSNMDESLTQYADDLLAERFKGERFVGHMRTLSDVIREEGVERIDLLKIDVEKSELDVLNGLGEEDWRKVKQIVLEVHDIGGRLNLIEELLKRHGFGVVVEQDPTLAGTGLYNIYAVNPSLIEAAGGMRPRTEEGSLLTPRSLRPLTTAELRAHLRERLPEYMVPANFVLLERMPLNANGKIDRKALPAPDDSSRDSIEGYVAPRTPVEEVLAAIWSDVLGVERVGACDNFFELGGHSLLATRVVSRVRQGFGVEVPLRALFEKPTVAGLAAEVEAALRGGASAQTDAIEAVEREGVGVPLSFAQQRLWFLEQLEPGGSVYNIPAAVRLSGRLDEAALARALSEVVRRHEVLRTTFMDEGGSPVQVVNEAAPVPLPLTDLTTLDHVEQESEAHRIFNEETRRPFDLTSGPLLRARLVKLGEREHVLVIVAHHIVTDGWSTAILVRDATALYDAFSAGRPSPLEELPIQYADFAAWQRKRLSGELLDEKLSYWKQHLAGAPPVLELPTDRPRPAVQSRRGASERFALDEGLSRALKALSRSEGVTLFMTLLAGFKVLLSRYSGQEEVVVGTPIAGREQIETEGLVGFFINALALRTNLAGDPTFRGLLGRVREVTLGAYAHQEVPFDLVVEELQPERSLSRSPIFQVIFALQNMPRESIELPELQLSSLEPEMGSVEFDINFVMSEADDRINGHVEYSTDLFDAATISRLLTHFELLLAAVVSDPEQHISTLPVLTDGERHTSLVEWNRTEVDYGPVRTLHQLFEQQAARTPAAVALAYEGAQLTYSELNERADNLARLLRMKGVGPDVLVGLLLERSVEMVVSILAVMKAGGAYLPLDPLYPADRLRFMVEDASVSLLLTHEHLRHSLPEQGAGVVYVSRGCADIAAVDDEVDDDNADVEASPDNIAYVIYTSGSTGRPKGVMVSHRAIANRLLWALEACPLTADDRVLQKTPFTFDASVWEIFVPLLSGARLVVARPEGHRDSAYLVETVIDEEITVLQLVPSMLRVFLQEPRAEECRSLRHVFCGGEELRAEDRDAFYERLCARLHNLYGPTEASIDATHWECEPGVVGTVPVGRPIANVRVYVLDAHLRPVPVGAPGELHIGGAGLARGYLNRPALTAEKFIPDPFGVEPGARLYKTGDLARYRADGRIEYMGRADQQVKVRGFRIELGEIEAALCAHTRVRQALVATQDSPNGDRRLVAYAVCDEGEQLSGGELRAHLQGRLPEYMVPASFVLLDEMPALPNGKIDRRALSLMHIAGTSTATEYVAPRTPVEETLAAIWAELLGLSRVGVNDNFFELGGHSLLATRAISRIRESFEVSVALRPLFESPTVAGWAAVIEGIQPEPADARSPGIEKVTRGEKSFDQLLAELSQLSESEVQTMLADYAESK